MEGKASEGIRIGPRARGNRHPPLPDYSVITIQYEPRKRCLELKAFKMYLLAYRNPGIFYENAVNRMLRDMVAAVKPAW